MNPTGTEARVCADIATRQAKGTAKYGTTVQDNPLGLIQWLQHAYEECLDQAVYLKRAMEQLTGVDEGSRIKAAIRTLEESGHSWSGGVLWRPPIGPRPAWLDEQKDSIPSNSAEFEGPHAELRKTWREGQRWQYRVPGEDPIWKKCLGEPDWDLGTIYRRHPEDKDAEPATRAEVLKATFPNPADPHAALKAIYRPGMRWRTRGINEGRGKWGPWNSANPPVWLSGMIYEIHPNDLPKEPTDDGWITVPDDCMEMPDGLKRGDRILAKYDDGDCDPEDSHDPAGAYCWCYGRGSGLRVVAYRLIKPAE